MTKSADTSQPFILFELDNTTYGIPSALVQKMEMVEQITPVPNSPSFVVGVVFSRGKVIPAIDLRVRLGLSKIPYTLRSRLIVINTNQRTVGLIVDTAREFVSIPAQTIQPSPGEISGLSGKYLAGIATLGERVILIMNVSELLVLPELVSEGSP